MGLPFENADYNEDEVGARKIPELTDVVLTDLANNEILVYNSSSEVWENQAQSSSIIEIDDISGVTITNVQNNQFLKYDNGEWINANITDNDTDNLNDLTDTLLTSPFGNDEVLKYLNGKWVNGNIPIEKLSNVHISNLQDGETLRYIHANGRWENVNNIDTLNELSDVNVSSNLNNHVLKYNNSTGVYENQFVNLTDLGDTNITTLANGNTLIYNNGIWSAGNISLSTFTNGTGISVTGTSPNFTITNTAPDLPVSFNNGTGISVTGNYPTFTITNTYQETDPVFSIHPASGITPTLIGYWNSAYGWGDHAAQNYLNTSSPAGSIQNGTGFLKNNGSGTWTYDTNTYLTSANIYQLGGLTWSNVNNNELIRRSGSTSADGAGMTLHDTSSPSFPQTTYYKDVSYFGRHGLLTIPFGVNRFESSFVGYNQRLIPYAPILLSTTPVSGLYLHHLPSINDYNVRVGVNNQYPSQDFQVGTTLYVDNTNRRVGIGIANPEEDLEVDGSIQIDSANVARLKFQQSGQNPHALGEIDGEQDGANGGDLQFYTKVNNGSVTEKLRINNVGAIGIGGAIYGTAGQVLSSNGSGNAVSWVSPVSNIYAGASISQIIGPAVNVETTFNSWTSQVASGITAGATNVFTAQSSGWYSLSFSISCKGTNKYNNFTEVILRIKKNGTNYHVLNDDDRPPGSTDINTAITFGGGIFIDLNTNDSITFTIQVNSDNHTVTGYCSLEKTADAPLSVPATEFGEVATSADTQGGKMILKTKDSLNQLTDKVIINHEGKLGFRSTNYGIAGDVLTNNASGLPEWATAGDLGIIKMRGDDTFVGDGYSYAGFVRAFHLYLNNANFANPAPSNATLSMCDYYGLRIGSNGTHPTISFPHNHVYFNYGYSQASDDRLKHNETPITDGLSVINQLNVLKYDRAKDFTSREDMKIEIGMIAQEVQTIPQLCHCVTEPLFEEDNYKMIYQDIHNYHIAATQELYKLVIDLQARIAVLEAK